MKKAQIRKAIPKRAYTLTTKPPCSFTLFNQLITESYQ